MAAEIALSVLDHLESNLICPPPGGERDERERKRWRKRNKNKVKCFN